MSGRMRKIATIGCGVALMAALAGCAPAATESVTEEKATPQEQQAGKQEQTQRPASSQPKDFNGSSYSDLGPGDLYVATSDGTSQYGNVPLLDVAGKTEVQIDVVMDGLSNHQLTLYVDGMEHSTISGMAEGSQVITLKGDALKPGEHAIEAVKIVEDDADGTPMIYKEAVYQVA